MFLLAATTESPVGGLVGLLIVLGGAALTIAWIVFPFIVMSRLDTLIRVTAEIRKETREALKESNFYLKAISDRLHQEKAGPAENVQRPTEEKKEPETYRI